MPQVVVTQRIEGLQRRSYAAGIVLTIADVDMIAWLKSRRLVDDTAAVVSAAISAGAAQVTHVAGAARNVRQASIENEADSGGPVFDAEGMRALVRSAPPRTMGNRASRNLGRQGQTAGAGLAGRSWHCAQTSECHFQAVRAKIFNCEASSFTLDAFLVAASSSISSAIPTGPLVQGPSGLVVPARLAAPTASPLRGVRPSETLIGTFNVPAIARADGSPLRALHWRAYVSTSPFSVGGANSGLSDLSPGLAKAEARGRYVYSAYMAGDFVSSNQAGFTTPIPVGVLPMIEIEFLLDRLSMTVLAVGDSFPHGVGGVNFCSYLHYACTAVSTEAQPVWFSNHAVPSTNTADSLAALEDLFDSGARPQAIVWGPSVNDGEPTPEIIAAAKARLAQVRDLCNRYGVMLCVTTLSCTSTAGLNWAAPSDNLRKAWNAELLALEAQGVYVADTASAWGDGATPERFQPEKTTDGVHPNTLGHMAGAEKLIPVLQRMKARCFV